MLKQIQRRLTLGVATLVAVLAALPAAGDEPMSVAWDQQEAVDELEGSFGEKARDLQEWLHQREAERRQSWGADVVTPENPAMKRLPSSADDYDPQGYRRLNENTRFRLRNQDGWRFDVDEGHAGSLRRAGKGQGEEAESDETDADMAPSGEDAPGTARRKKRRGRN